MIIPFGKHKGRQLDEVPESYLLWILDKCEHASPTLKQAIREQLDLVKKESQLSQECNILRFNVSMLNGKVARIQTDTARAITSVYHRYAMRYHPDRCGSPETMSIINQVFADIRGVLAKV